MPNLTPSAKPLDLGGAVRKTVRAKKIIALKPPGGGTLHAKSQAFASRVAGSAHGDVGFQITSEDVNYPFDTKYLSDLYRAYDGTARAFIAEALKFRGKGVIISGNQGTAPELAILGAHLVTKGFKLGINLFHQSIKLYGLRANDRAFTVDVAASYGGVLYLYPIDGVYFHLKSELQVLDSLRRNWELETAGGVVAPILDTECYVGAALRLRLREYGAPV